MKSTLPDPWMAVLYFSVLSLANAQTYPQPSGTPRSTGDLAMQYVGTPSPMEQLPEASSIPPNYAAGTDTILISETHESDSMAPGRINT